MHIVAMASPNLSATLCRAAGIAVDHGRGFWFIGGDWFDVAFRRS